MRSLRLLECILRSLLLLATAAALPRVQGLGRLGASFYPRRVRQGLGAPAGSSLPALDSVVEYPALPWRCEAVPPAYGRQRWYSQQPQEQQEQPARRRFQGSTPPVPEANLRQQSLGSSSSGDAGGSSSSGGGGGGLVKVDGHPHDSVCAWLQQHFANRSTESIKRQLARAAGIGALQQAPLVPASIAGLGPAGAAWPPLWLKRLWGGSSGSAAPAPAPESEGVKREFLVVAPIGSAFDASRWMDDPAHATWDLIGIYYGYANDFSCSLCKKVYAGQGPKWRLAYALYSHPDWAQLSRQYKAVMVADENVGLSTAAVNRAFAVMHEYNLLLAQPSVCKMARTSEKALKQHRQYTLRYTTFVDIMAPMFRMDFFNGMVGPMLYDAYAGTALDWVIPFLLRYPADEIAVIDAVCVSHLDWAALTRLILPRYPTWAPYGPQEEELRRFAQYGYYPSEVEKVVGLPLYTDRSPFPERFVRVLGAVPNPAHKSGLGLGAALAALLLGAAAGVCAGVATSWGKHRGRGGDAAKWKL